MKEQIRVSHVIAQHITEHITAVEAHHTKCCTRLRRDAYLTLALATAAMLGLCIALIFVSAG
ncbi:hypothetical protein [Streptomyces sp. 2A115]|uniref:hypothetical protein n=1 Tax=Streptomyces sp. 2A115 TaxID=3457439 RepID=UPI003FD44624